MNRIEAFARFLYHRLPISQRAKWRLRERLYPLLSSLRRSPDAHGLMQGMNRMISAAPANDPLVVDAAIEHALAGILEKLARHAEVFGPPAYWIALPFLATGGAERVALNLAQALREARPGNSVVLLATDRKLGGAALELPGEVCVVAFDDWLGEGAAYARKQALLRSMLLACRPHFLHNINSEVAWHLILAEGEHLKRFTRLYASIFAFQFASDGKTRIGYAEYFLKQGIPHLSGLLSDNRRFIEDAANVYELDAPTRARMHAIYQPCRLFTGARAAQLPTADAGSGVPARAHRLQVLWAGRLDAEKRVDLLLSVIRLCDFADFHIFGQVVLGDNERLPSLPNLFYEGPFSSPLQWVERHRFDAFVFTSRWEGMPNTLIEAGALGIPVIAPTVGGIGELISEQTGFALPERPSAEDYRAALAGIAESPVDARQRADRLRELVELRHAWPAFADALSKVPDYLGPMTFAQQLAAPRALVSVVIPCFNQGRYLRESIESALLARRANLEIIVIDDGSTEGKIGRYLSEAASLAPDMVRVHRQKNGGLSAARNAGLALAKGDFIQFLDADDLLAPGKLDAQVAQLCLNPALDVSVCNFLLCDASRNEYSKHDEAIASFDLNREDFLYRWERGFAIPIHCGVFRRSALANVRFDEEARAKEDWLFWTDLSLRGVRFGYVHGHWAIYRQHESSMRRSYYNMGQSWLQAGLKIEARLGSEAKRGGAEALFFESVVSWFEQCYRSHPQYREEVAERQVDVRARAQAGPLLAKLAGTEPASTETVGVDSTPTAISASLLELLSALADSVDPPLISVVVPIFNHFEYLHGCLASVAAQRGVSLEVVCVDDGSSDERVRRMLRDLEGKNPRVQVIMLERNSGISHAQNLAVSAARGEFVAFLDCDDELEPGALSVVREAIDASPAVDYLFSDRSDVDESGNLVRQVRYGGYENIPFRSQEHIGEDLLDGMVASHLKVIRRSAYLSAGGCDDAFSGVQDWELALKLVGRGAFRYLDRALYRHRVHPASVTRGDLVAQFRKTNVVRRIYSMRWLRPRVSEAAPRTVRFTAKDFPVALEALKQHWRQGDICVADATGQLNVGQLNFLREFNSYFDRVEWDDPRVPCSVLGYLWDRDVLAPAEQQDRSAGVLPA